MKQQSFDNGKETYKLVYEVATSIINAYYQRLNKKREFPIDIRGIVCEEGISIAEMNLNVDIGFQLDHVNAYLRHMGDGDKWQIYIDYNDSEYTKRYMIAHEFSHYLLKESDNENTYNCTDPFFTNKWEELLADVLATYFLLPSELVLECMLSYTKELKEKNQYPLDVIQWLKYLGSIAQVSSYHTIIGYQYIKYILCFLYNEDSEKYESYKEFFK